MSWTNKRTCSAVEAEVAALSLQSGHAGVPSSGGGCSADATRPPARPRRACGCAAQSDAPLPPTRALRRHTPGALWDRLADGTVGCVACEQ